MELFQRITDNYNTAAAEIWWWHSQKGVLGRLVSFPWAAFAWLVMRAIGWLFLVGVVLDVIASILERSRAWVMATLDDHVDDIQYQKRAYIKTLVIAGLLAPVALLLGVFPKWSSTVVDGISDQEYRTGTEHGFFTRMFLLYFKIPMRMFRFCFSHGVFFGLLALILSILVTPAAWCIAAVFMLLIVLDWLSCLVDKLRMFVVNSSGALAKRSGSNGFSALFCPTLLAILLPVYIVLLIIPKISSQSDG